MRRRLLDVTAHTTLDFVDARALSPDREERASAVVDVGRPEADGRRTSDVPGDDTDGRDGRVHLSVELDAADLADLPRHVDRLDLSPADARTLAADLLEAAEAVDAAADTGSDGADGG